MPGRPVKIRHLYIEQQIHVAEAVRFALWCFFLFAHCMGSRVLLLSCTHTN